MAITQIREIISYTKENSKEYGVKAGVIAKLYDLEKYVNDLYNENKISKDERDRILKSIRETIAMIKRPDSRVAQIVASLYDIEKMIEKATTGAAVPTPRYEYESPLDEIKDPATRTEVKERTLRAYESFLWFIADPTQENWKAFQTVWDEVPNEYKEAAKGEINERIKAMLTGDWDTACKGMRKNKMLVIKDALEPHTDLLGQIFRKGDFYYNAGMLAEAYEGTQMLIKEFSSAREVGEYETAWAKIKNLKDERRAAYNLAVRYTYGLYTHRDETGKTISAEDMLKEMWNGAKGNDALEILENIGEQIIKDRSFRQKKRDFINKYGEETLAKMDLIGQYSFLTWTWPAIEAAGRATFYLENINEYYDKPEKVDPDQFTKEMIEKCGDVAMAVGYAGQAGLFARGIPRILGYYNEYHTIMSILNTIEATAEGIQGHFAPISSRVMKHYCEVQVPDALDAALGAFLGRAEQYLLKDPSEALGAITPEKEKQPWGEKFELEDPVTKWERMVQMRAGANITPLDIRLPQNFSLFEGETYLYLTPDDVRARAGVDIKSAREIYRDVFSLASLRMLPERYYWAVRPPPASYFDLIARLAQVDWQRILLGTEFTTATAQSAADGLMEWAGVTTRTARGTATLQVFGPRSKVELTGAAGEAALEKPVDETGQVNDAYLARLAAQDIGSENWNIDKFDLAYTKSDISYYTPREGEESEVLNEDLRGMLDLYHKETNSDIVMFAERNTINGYYTVYAYWLKPPMKKGEESVWVRAGVFRMSEEQATNWFAGYTSTTKDFRAMLTEGKGLSAFILGLQTDLLAKGIGGAVIYDKEGKINLGTVMDIVLESSTTGNLNNGVVYFTTFWDTKGNLPKLTVEKFKGAGIAYEKEWKEETDVGPYIGRGWVLGGIGEKTADRVIGFGWQKRNVGVDATWLQRMNERGEEKGRAGWGGYFENRDLYSFIMANFLYSLTGTEGAVGAIEFKDATFLEKPRLQVSWFHANRELKHYQFQAARNAFLEKLKEENDILKEIDGYRFQLQGHDPESEEYKEIEAKIRDAERRLLVVRKEQERWRNIANRLFLAAAGEQYWTAQFVGGGFGLEAALGMSKDYLAMLANTFVEFDRAGASANFGYRSNIGLKTGGGKIIMPLGDALAAIQGGAWTSTYGEGQTVFGGIVSNPYSEKGAGVVGGTKKEWIIGNVTAPGRTDVTTYESGVFGWWGGPLEGMAGGTRHEVYVLMKYENGVFTPHRIDMTGEQWKQWKFEPGYVLMRIDPLTGKQFIFSGALLLGKGEIQRMEGLFTKLEEGEIGGAVKLERVESGNRYYGELSAVYQTLKPKGAPETQRYGILWLGGNVGFVIPIG